MNTLFFITTKTTRESRPSSSSSSSSSEEHDEQYYYRRFWDRQNLNLSSSHHTLSFKKKMKNFKEEKKGKKRLK